MVSKKKGISPIIATILLVVVSLVLVGILLAWGQSYIQRSTSDADAAIDRKCIGADIEISNCDYDKTENTISFIIRNTGKIDFKADNPFSLIVYDVEDNVGNFSILEGKTLGTGTAQKVVVPLSDAPELEDNSPYTVIINNSQCKHFYKRLDYCG